MKKIVSRLRNVYSFISLSHGYRNLLFLFLFPVFFVLHGYNENFGIIPFSVILSLLIKYFIITLAIIIANLVLFGVVEKTFLYSFYLLLLFFLFGRLYDTLHDLFTGSLIYSYKVLLPSLAIVSVLFWWWLHKRKKTFAKATRFVSLLLIVFCVLEVVMFAYYLATGKQEENDLSGDFKIENNKPAPCSNDHLPDIYFIVFDGYTSSKLLKEEFQFDNSGLDSLLIKNNFFISSSSKSNYNFTAFSLASTFGLDHLKKGSDTGIIQPANVLQAVNTLKENEMIRFLKTKGYRFKNYGRFEIDEMPLKDDSFFDYFYYDLIDKQTLYARVKRDLGWHLAAKNMFTGKFRAPGSFKKRREEYLQRNESNYQQLLKELSSDNDSPKFVYAHLMLPHEPFYLKADGSLTDDYGVIFDTLDKRKGYIEQVLYSNKLLEKLIDASASDGKRERVIIIEGDHGYRFYDQANLLKEFPNLNVYYFSDHDYNMLYDGISPVNSFRVILNKYFCYELGMVKDTSFYLKKPGQY